MKAYRLTRDGQIVHTLRSTAVNPDGTRSHLTSGVVGRAGQVFTDLPQHVVEGVESGEINYLEEIELSNSSTEEDSGVQEDLQHSHGTVEHSHELEFKVMSTYNLNALAEQHELDVTGTGTGGSVRKADYVAALEALHEGA